MPLAEWLLPSGLYLISVVSVAKTWVYFTSDSGRCVLRWIAITHVYHSSFLIFHLPPASLCNFASQEKPCLSMAPSHWLMHPPVSSCVVRRHIFTLVFLPSSTTPFSSLLLWESLGPSQHLQSAPALNQGIPACPNGPSLLLGHLLLLCALACFYKLLSRRGLSLPERLQICWGYGQCSFPSSLFHRKCWVLCKHKVL